MTKNASALCLLTVILMAHVSQNFATAGTVELPPNITLEGDTNGDGTNERITVRGDNRVEVFHQQSGTTNTYSLTTSYSYWALTDVDGAPGVEIVIISDDVYVVNDSRRTLNRYNVVVSGYGLRGFDEMNGVTGDEIFVDSGGGGAVTIVSPRSGEVNVYTIPGYGVYATRVVEDTNGEVGKELVIATSYDVFVIHDSTESVARYLPGALGGNWRLANVTDTDSLPGAEIIVSTPKAVEVIRDRSGIKKVYDIYESWSLRGISDFDHTIGADICYGWAAGSRSGTRVIIDRSESVVEAAGLNCEVANQAPRAVAGQDREASVGSTVILDGTGSSDDGLISSYSWSQIAGPGVVLEGSSSSVARFVAPSVTADTVFTFRLVIRDNRGAEAGDDISITVRRPQLGWLPAVLNILLD